MSCGSKIYSKMHPVSCTYTDHDVIDLLNPGIVKNAKTWISWEPNKTFLRNKKILYLCLNWHFKSTAGYKIVYFFYKNINTLCSIKKLNELYVFKLEHVLGIRHALQRCALMSCRSDDITQSFWALVANISFVRHLLLFCLPKGLWSKLQNTVKAWNI